MWTFSDSIPTGHIKYIHTEGAVAQIAFVPAATTNPFTGVFKGADHGIIRLSMAVEPDTVSTTTVPSFGLKLLRDSIDSANVVAEYSA
jgi:hypothetical protein